MMNEQILDALLSINVPEGKARAAAISLATPDPKIDRLDQRLQTLEVRMTSLEVRMTALDGKLNTLQWMLGVNLAFLLTIVFKLFHIA